MSKTIHINVGGMACSSCQETITDALKSTKGVKKVSVSYVNGTADVEFDESKITEKAIKKVITDTGYKVLSDNRNAQPNFVTIIGYISIILILFYALQMSGILNHLVPGDLADTSMGYGMLFVIGLVTSVHCIAMCGGIGLSMSLPKNQNQEKANNLQVILPNLAYNLGRVCSYTIIGAVLGFVGMIIGGGANVAPSIHLQAMLKLIAGVFMIFMGINLLGIFPWLRKIAIPTPKFLTKFIRAKKRSARQPFVVGLLNGLMPCGPLQAMWIVALATGTPLSGALSMFMFSLGTVPLMLGLGSVISMLGKKFTTQVMQVGAIMVVVLGLGMISQGVSLHSGTQLIPSASSTTNKAEAPAETPTEAPASEALDIQMEDGVQIINSTLTPGRYPDITVKAGVPVKWTLNAPEGTLTSCNYRMVIPDYGIQYELGYGDNIIEFTPTDSGDVGYTCWMGMVQGNISVVE